MEEVKETADISTQLKLCTNDTGPDPLSSFASKRDAQPPSRPAAQLLIERLQTVSSGVKNGAISGEERKRRSVQNFYQNNLRLTQLAPALIPAHLTLAASLV